MSGSMITITAFDGGKFEAYMTIPAEGSGPRLDIASGNIWNQSVSSRYGSKLCRRRICGSCPRFILADAAWGKSQLR